MGQIAGAPNVVITMTLSGPFLYRAISPRGCRVRYALVGEFHEWLAGLPNLLGVGDSHHPESRDVRRVRSRHSPVWRTAHNHQDFGCNGCVNSGGGRAHLWAISSMSEV
jgi:hypothetical protein